MSIDAYAHIGYPRYGRPEELEAVWRRSGVQKGCIALPPGMPDFEGLSRARQRLGERVRLFGIPYGPDSRSRLELAELQVRFGIQGMRLAPNEVLENPDVLGLLGEAHLSLMAINVHEDARVTAAILRWLETYPHGTVASPHFLSKLPVESAAADPGAFRDLLRHPRMYAIFSRHGGISAVPRPHGDLRPWVEDVLPLLTWDRVLWGSESPVLFHRDELVKEAEGWLRELGVAMTEAEESAYLGGNADGLFFSSKAPPADPEVEFPHWVAEGLAQFITANDPVPTVRTDALHLPLDLHGRLQSGYLREQESNPALRFQEYLVGLLQSRGSSS